MSANRKLNKKHIPKRTCIVCRETLNKRDLHRIVKTSEKNFLIDKTGKVAGRGAYLCDKPICWQKGLTLGYLNRAFKLSLTNKDLIDLQEQAQTMNLLEIKDER